MICRFVVVGLVLISVADAASASAAKLSYNEHIQPILAENCFSCHGPDSSTRKAKLRLDRAEFATAKRDDLPAITPGHPDLSALVERITSTDDEERMPPLESHKELRASEIALLKRWIAEGATYEQHWSLIAPVRPAVPAVPLAKGWARNPVDHFIAETLAASGLKPNGEEERARLLRRVTFDLTGLPPKPADIAAFVADRAPDAYERVVDRLLASDASAEQFTRYWLDAVRYGDTHGIHLDNYRSIWPYRDWVIEAFRKNMPFDQFTIEQMAGDLLPGATLDQKIASGYNRCLPTTSEGGAIPAEYDAIYAKDRVETMSAVWLGLTTGCAACHDHKFDPITTKDFYSLTAFFRNNTMPAMDGNFVDTEPSLFVPPRADRARWDALQKEIADVKTGQQARVENAEVEAGFSAWIASAKSLVAPPLDHTVSLHVPLSDGKRPAQIGPAPADGPASAGLTDRDGQSIRADVAVGAGGDGEFIRGPFGPAPRIDGRNIVLGPAVPWRRDDQISFGLWVWIEGAPTGTLLSCLSEEDPDHGWELFLEKGKIGHYVSEEKGGVTARSVARQPLTPGQWHHLLFVYDGPAQRHRCVDVYVDGGAGASAGEMRGFRGDVIPHAPLRLGSRHTASGEAGAMLTGGKVWVQDVRRYDRAFFVQQAAEFAELARVDQAFVTGADQRTSAQKKALRAHYLATVDAPAMELAARLDRLAAEEDMMRKRGAITLVMEEKKNSEAFAHVLTRGEYTQLGEKVPAATPVVLPPLPDTAPRNRLGLARWLVAPENPLTARVTVNRVWQQIFGTGLVESAGDFGVTGSRPSHPKLLDWLAVEFRETGWDHRRLLKLLVTSATYRQSAAITPSLLERDPANRLLARGPRHRLDAEELRDQALAASELLVAQIGGRPVRPYQPEGVWEEVAMKQSTTRFYKLDEGENLYRRSLYTLWKRTALNPAMDILNAPNREVACVRRDRTNTPLQALVTLNEPLFVEASRQLAVRVMRDAKTFEDRLGGVALRLIGRAFSPAERAVVQRTFTDAFATYRREPAAAQALLAVGASPMDTSLPAAELAAWTFVASEVMNLDESLTK